MELYLHNTLGRKKEVFRPIKENSVRLYHCGPTVYWTQHIGNMRAVFFADTVVRTLRHFGYKTTLVRNYTDVGHLTGDNIGDADVGIDRMEKTATRENKTPEEIAKFYIAIYNADISRLGVLPTDHSPKATDYIAEMQKMVQKLVDTGYAYITPQAIYFDTSRVSDYTKLSLQKLENNITGTGHGAVQDSAKKNPSDFSLWFFKTGAHEDALQTWESPFTSPLVQKGLGFPGWHIECSAMSKHFLGETFDIHMGGIEHIPVHHTNEIAQSESANQTTYVRYWLHNEHLTVGGGKMAKSEGTSITMDDIVARGYNPLSLRFFFMQAHYRSKQNFTWEALAAAETAYMRIIRFTQSVEEVGKISHKYSLEFKEALSDDLNTSAALSVAFEVLKDASLSDADKKATLLDFDSVLGLDLGAQLTSTPIPPQIQKLAEERNIAKMAKEWAKADSLRLQIEEGGYDIKDTKDGFEIQKI